jgi:hypothetical protein
VSSRALLLDTQLLVLLLVGLTSKDLIAKHKRLRAYAISDFELLENMVRSARQIVVTTNVFTEASNLARQTPEPDSTRIGETFRLVAQRAEERHMPTRDAVNTNSFLTLGLADSVALECAEGTTLLTADLDLHIAAAKRGIKSVNFNHLREQV